VALATVARSCSSTTTGTDDQALRAEIGRHLAGLRADGDPEVEVRMVDDGGDAAEAVIDLAVGADAERLVVGVKRRSRSASCSPAAPRSGSSSTRRSRCW
jgi:hypothetical protein